MSTTNSATRLVAVTGASGFIGRHTVQGLASAGFRLRLLARDPARVPPLTDSTEILVGTLRDSAVLARLMQDAQAVVHIAGSVRGATREQFDRVNALGAEACARAASAAGIARFLLLSSLAAREPQLSAYAASKRAGEERVVGVAGTMAVTILRPPAVYGPGDTEMLALFRFMARGVAPVFGSLRARFSLIYVADLASAIVAWAGDETPRAGLWEIDDGKPGGYGWPEVCATVSSLTGRPVRPIRVPRPLLGLPAGVNYLLGRMGIRAPMLTPGKVRELRHPDWVSRPGLPATCPGWQPHVRLADGLAHTPGWR
jgi:nucleoside-diphosphate-sugar epimerase